MSLEAGSYNIYSGSVPVGCYLIEDLSLLLERAYAL